MTATELKLTKSQKWFLEELKKGGWTIEKCEVMEFSKRLWVSAERKWCTEKCPNGHPLLDHRMWGTIGVKGAIDIEFMNGISVSKYTNWATLRSNVVECENYAKAPAKAPAEEPKAD